MVVWDDLASGLEKIFDDCKKCRTGAAMVFLGLGQLT
jgi:hypothetical protein